MAAVDAALDALSRELLTPAYLYAGTLRLRASEVQDELAACKTLAIATFHVFLPGRRRAYPNFVTTLTLIQYSLSYTRSWVKQIGRDALLRALSLVQWK